MKIQLFFDSFLNETMKLNAYSHSSISIFQEYINYFLKCKRKEILPWHNWNCYKYSDLYSDNLLSLRKKAKFPTFQHGCWEYRAKDLCNRWSHLTHLISFDTRPPPFASFKKIVLEEGNKLWASGGTKITANPGEGAYLPTGLFFFSFHGENRKIACHKDCALWSVLF